MFALVTLYSTVSYDIFVKASSSTDSLSPIVTLECGILAISEVVLVLDEVVLKLSTGLGVILDLSHAQQSSIYQPVSETSLYTIMTRWTFLVGSSTAAVKLAHSLIRVDI